LVGAITAQPVTYALVLLVDSAGHERGPQTQAADINGVLWLDRASSELRRLEYGYTGLEGWVPVQLIGGWIDFRRLPNGAPLIVAWQIRAPIPLQAGQRRKLYGFKEREGRVINVFTANGHPVTLPSEKPWSPAPR